MSLRDALQNVPAYHFSAKEATVKLDQNESPYDLPDELKAKVLSTVAQTAFNRYPELDARSLKTKLAERYAWTNEGVVVTGGSNVLIQAFVMAAGLGQQVLSVTPTFSVYPLQAQLQGADLVEAPLGEDFSLPLAGLLDKLEQGRGVFFLANPAAPTGNVFSEEALEQLAQASAQNWLMVVDEAYYQFSGTDALGLVKRHSHVASIRTFSKAFGLGGVRLGFGLMQPRLAEQLQKTVMPFSVSALQLETAKVVLDAPDFVESRVQEALREREKLFRALERLPNVTPFPSSTNFILFKVPDASAFYEQLLARGILIRRQDHLPGLTGCLRVSVGTPQENQLFVEAAQTIAASNPPEKELSHG